eukprot:171208_1
MALFLNCILLFYIVSTATAVISYSVHCFNAEGSLPTQQSPSSTSACPIPYSLTSCTLKPITVGLNDEPKGSYITYDNKCVAWSTFYGDNGGGIQVFARCCDFSGLGSTSQQNIATYTSPISADNDDAVTSVSCTSNQALIGCTSFGNTIGYDGSFVGLADNPYPGNKSHGIYDTDNICSAQNGYNGVGVYAYATCYDKTSILNGYEIDCVMVLGNWSTGNTQSGTPSSVTCPSNEYFMTSCAPFSWWNSIAENYIQNNQCIVTDNRGGSYQNIAIHSVAYAVCCRMIIPTSSPTINPTRNPIEPTISPSSTLTINPTSVTPGPTLSPYPSGNIIGCFDTSASYCPNGVGCFGSNSCAQCNFPISYSSNLLHTCSIQNLSSICHNEHPNYCAYTSVPSNYPTQQPTISPETHIPTISPTNIPTTNPTFEPTLSPIFASNNPTYRPTQSPFETGNAEVTMITTQNINHNTDESLKPIYVWEIGKYMFIIVIALILILCCICCVLCCRIHNNKNGNKNQTGYKIDTKQIMRNKIQNNPNNDINLQLSGIPSFLFKNKNKKESSTGIYNNKISIVSILDDEDEGTVTNTNNNNNNNTNSGLADDEFEIITKDISDDKNNKYIGEPHGTIDIVSDVILTGSDDENETPGTDENNNEEDVITSEGTGDSDEPVINDEYEQTVTFTGKNDNDDVFGYNVYHDNNHIIKELQQPMEEIKYNDDIKMVKENNAELKQKSSDESIYMDYHQYKDKKIREQINNDNQKTDNGMEEI